MPYRYRLCVALAAIQFMIIALAPALQGQSWQWGRKGGGPNLDLATDIGLDRFGNSYMVGTFDRSITFGSLTLNNGATVGLFVAKYSPAGNLLWLTQGTGSGHFANPSIAVDKDGNSYVAGGFSGNASFGSVMLSSAGDFDMFLIRLDPAGDVKWGRRGGGPGADMGTGIAMDTLVNDCIITGTFEGTARFDTLNVTSTGKTDLFLVKYNAFGEVKWLTRNGSPENDLPKAVAVNESGSSYVLGDFFGTSLFGDTVGGWRFTGHNIFLVKYSPTGVFQWAIRYGGFHEDNAQHLAVDRFGNSYLTGTFTDSASIGNFKLKSAGGTDFFMAKLDGTGAPRWVVQGGGKGNDTGFAVTVDAMGNTFFTGTFRDSAMIGGVQVVDSGGGDIFVVKLDGSGNTQWVRSHGGPNADRGSVIAINRNAEVLAGGMYSSDIRFGPSLLTHSGGGDIFFGKLGTDPEITTGAISGSPFCAGTPIGIPFSIVGVFNDDNVFTAQLSDSTGSFASPVTLGSRNGTTDDVIAGSIPTTVRPGNRYRIRVVSSSPAITGSDNGNDLLFYDAPTPTISANGSLNICAGSSVTLDAGAGYTSYQWSTGAATRTIAVTEPGDYTVTVANDVGCTGTSQPVIVVRRTSPAKPTVTQNGSMLESSLADSYQWLRDDVEIDGATDRRYFPSQSGNYTVRVRNAEGCTAVSNPVAVTVSSVAEEESIAGALKLYPQPASGEFTLELAIDGENMVRVTIHDGLGKEVLRLEEPASGGIYRRMVDLSGFSAGAYFVEVESNGRRWSQRMVKR